MEPEIDQIISQIYDIVSSMMEEYGEEVVKEISEKHSDLIAVIAGQILGHFLGMRFADSLAYANGLFLLGYYLGKGHELSEVTSNFSIFVLQI